MCGAGSSLVVQEGGMGEQPGTGGDCWPVGHSMCPLCSPGIESASFRARLAPPGENSPYPVQSSGPCPPPGEPLLPRAHPTKADFPSCSTLSPAQLSTCIPPCPVSAALPPWMPLSSAIWPCCCRRSCPVGSCRPTFTGCTTSASTAPTSLTSTSPATEVGSGWGGWAGVRGLGSASLAHFPCLPLS